MTIRIYDLVGLNDCRFSSNCWRIHYALAHKGLDVETIPTRFTEIADIGDGSHPTIPVIEDGDRRIGESWDIAEYLEETYPDAPSLFGGLAGRAYARFVQRWCETRINPFAITLIINDIYEQLTPEDRPYFHESRSKRLGAPIEAAMLGRKERLPEFRARLDPLRRIVEGQSFLGGDTPLYADYLAMAPMIWARKTSPFALVEDGDPVHAWMHRCLDLYAGLGRHGAGYDW